MDDYKIALGALLDANAKGDIDKQLNAIKDLSVTISKATLSNDVINDIKRQLTQNGIDLKLVFGNVGQITNQAKQTGQQIGQQIQSGINSAIQKGNLQKDFFFSADKKNDVAKRAQEYFRGVSNGIVTVTEQMTNLDNNSELRGFIVNIKNAKGEVESLRYSLRNITDDNGNVTGQKFAYTGGAINDAGAIKQIQAIENAFADYTAKLAQFESTNTNILSGLTTPLQDFETKLAGLKNGTATIDEVKNSFKLLGAEASKVTANFTGQLSKTDSAIRKLAQGDEIMDGLKASFKGLSNAPKDINTELNKVSKLLREVRNVESQEGRTANWSAKYREWSDEVDKLKAKLSVLQKQQASMTTPQIFKTSDLRSADIPYMTKVSNTIEKQMGEIQKMANAKGWQNFEVKGIEKADGQIKSLTLTVREADGALKQFEMQRAKLQGSGKAQTGLMQVGDVKIIETASQAQAKLAQQTENANAKLQEQVNKIQLLFDNGYGDSAYGNRIKQIENDFVKYGLSVDEASQKTQTLRNILNGFKDTDGNFLPDDKLVAQANKLETEFKAVKVSVDSAKLSYDKFLQPVSSDKASSLIIRINDFLTKNTAITKKAKEELLGFIRLLQNGNVNLSDWNKFDTRLKEINQEMRVAGKLGKSLKQTLIDGAKSFAQWTLSSGAVMEVWNGFKQGIRNVKELDDSLVELNKVTDLTVEGLSKVTEESFELGEKLAKTGTKVLDSVTSFSRAGYNIEDSMKYAEEALKTTNISENLKDAGQAADSLVNIMKGFQDETPEFAKKINDSVNQVSNTEAVDFDNLIDGATRLSAVADQAGMSFEQMLGTLTGAYEVLGNMEKVANGQITIFTRLQAIQMEGEEEVSTVAKLQDKFSNTTNGAVNIVDKTTGQLRNVYDILDDLSDVWDTLDKNTQEALAFEAAGTRQKNVFLSMMQNWQGVEDAVKSAENSIGSADEENQAYLNSLSGKLEDLESALQHISKTLIDSNLLKFFVDLGTTGVKSVDALIESLSPLGTLLTIGSGIAGAKGLGLTNYVTQS